MALEVIEHQTPPEGRSLTRLLEELQGLKIAVAPGVAANTNIPVAGIGLDDTILSVLEVVDPGSAATTPAVVDRTATSSITSAGNVRCTASTVASGAGARVVVVWHDKNPL